jgi:3-methylcrotonyl-CoA carboxylase alpha subunit
VFRRLLVANRGEIAVRILQACAELGIAGVAVYTAADAGALHVRRAQVAVSLDPSGGGAGAGAGRSAYLDAAALVAAAVATGAGALHPGYGYLSESPDLADACRAAGIVFVGPPPEAMRLLGDKRRARALAREAGLPLLPGYEGAAGDSAQTLQDAAGGVGYPLLVKAAAGGGGRGIRRVTRAEDLPQAVAAARREAGAAFGDETIFLEAEAAGAHHVEVQILADAHGHILHLGERDCSVQRRRQKVVEECPSPVVTPALRRRLGEYAVRLCRAAGYVNAATVEFLVTPPDVVAFLEVNVRLQVEHPVTEAVTGIDLVREQIAIAAGRPLGFAQEDVSWRGHAVQCRLYAEDPAAGFLPSAGTVRLFAAPLGAGVRCDAGVETGDTVAADFDPLLAKLIVWAPDRAAALARSGDALRRSAVLGVATNLTLLQRILSSPALRSGEWHTTFLESRLEALLEAPDADDAERRLLAAAGWRLTAPDGGGAVDPNPWRSGPWRPGGQGVPLRSSLHGAPATVTAWRTGDGWEVESPAGRRRLRFRRAGPDTLIVDDPDGQRVWAARVVADGERLLVSVDGRAAAVEPPSTPEAAAAAGGGAGGAQSLTAPLPGVVAQVRVVPGQAVAAGEALVILEAMKMEFAVGAPYGGTVRRVGCVPGERVAAGTVLVEMEA